MATLWTLGILKMELIHTFDNAIDTKVYLDALGNFWESSTKSHVPYRLRGWYLETALTALYKLNLLSGIPGVTFVGSWVLLPSGSAGRIMFGHFHLYTRLDLAMMSGISWLPVEVREHLGY